MRHKYQKSFIFWKIIILKKCDKEQSHVKNEEKFQTYMTF